MTKPDQDHESPAESSDGKGIWRIVAMHMGGPIVFFFVGLMILACSGKDAEWAAPVVVLFFIFIVALASAQAAMLGAVAACSSRPFLFRVRWLFRLLLVQWICLTLPAIANVNHWAYPLCIFLDQLLVCVPSFLVAGLVRLLSRRVLIRRSIPNGCSREGNQFSVADLLVLTTCVAVVLGVIQFFPQEVTGWGGLIYVAIVSIGVFVGLPTGVLVPLLAWGFFTERDRPATICRRSWIGLIGVTIAGILLSVIIGSVLNSEDGMKWAFFSFGVLTALTATFITAIAFRRRGYRFQRRMIHDALAVPVDP